MIIEERCYVLHSHWSVGDYMRALMPEALDLQREILGGLIGYFSTEVGELNAIVSLWQYESFEERLRRRKLLADDPRWQRYLGEVRPMIRTMKNRLMNREA